MKKKVLLDSSGIFHSSSIQLSLNQFMESASFPEGKNKNVEDINLSIFHVKERRMSFRVKQCSKQDKTRKMKLK